MRSWEKSEYYSRDIRALSKSILARKGITREKPITFFKLIKDDFYI